MPIFIQIGHLSIERRTSLVDADEAYGLLHTGSFGGDLSVCVSRSGRQISMTARRRIFFLNPDESVERSLTEADWTRLKKQLETADFWALPEHHGETGLDGFDWTIEGRDVGRYHSSSCWCPYDGAFHELGSLLVEFSGLKIPDD